MKKAKKNIILNNKDKSYDELFKLTQDDEEAKVKALLETRGVKDKLKLLSENNKTGLYDVKLLNFIVDAEPENYVRERVVRGGQAYNPKTNIMKEYTNYLLPHGFLIMLLLLLLHHLESIWITHHMIYPYYLK